MYTLSSQASVLLHEFEIKLLKSLSTLLVITRQSGRAYSRVIQRSLS